jgi:hypothetical protein
MHLSLKQLVDIHMKKQHSRRETKFLTIEYLSFTMMQVSSYKLICMSMYIQMGIALAYVILNPCIYTCSSYFAYRRKRIRIAAHFLEVTGVNSL